MNIPKLYRLSLDDVDKASDVLRDAFYNYPTFKYLFPDIDARQRKLKTLMEFFIKCGLLNGEVYAPSENIEGVAIWYDSGKVDLSLQDLFRAGLPLLVLGLNPALFIKLKGIGNAKKANRKKLMRGEYYLLDVIGVDPAFAGKGYGRLLIESKLEQIKEQGMNCFVETSNTENMDYYKHFGFDLLHKYGYGGLQSFCMLKE